VDGGDRLAEVDGAIPVDEALEIGEPARGRSVDERAEVWLPWPFQEPGVDLATQLGRIQHQTSL
jgi:hypothetical protein